MDTDYTSQYHDNKCSCSNHAVSYFCEKVDGSSDKNGKSLAGTLAGSESSKSNEDSQLCSAITEGLNSAKEKGLDTSNTTPNIYNGRKFKTTTISITNNEYDY